jgi:hypothetical protein
MNKLSVELSNLMKSKSDVSEEEIREVINNYTIKLKEERKSTPIPELSPEYIDNFRLKLESTSKDERQKILISILECISDESQDLSHDVTIHPEIKAILKNYKDELIEANSKLKFK